MEEALNRYANDRKADKIMEKPFWEQTYQDEKVSTFSKGPTGDVSEFYSNFNDHSLILDVGCGEGRNSIFLAEKGHKVDAFDISEAGINKAINIAKLKNVDVNFWSQDLTEYEFTKEYDVILSHGVLHLPEREARNMFIERVKHHTKAGGYNIIGIFTNRLPATPDNAPFTKSLFDVGELPDMYSDWEIVSHLEGIFTDEHPGGIHHEHAYERIIARKK